MPTMSFEELTDQMSNQILQDLMVGKFRDSVRTSLETAVGWYTAMNKETTQIDDEIWNLETIDAKLFAQFGNKKFEVEYTRTCVTILLGFLKTKITIDTTEPDGQYTITVLDYSQTYGTWIPDSQSIKRFTCAKQCYTATLETIISRM